MLNCYFKSRCLLLEPRWNYRDAEVEVTSRIQHFAGSPKPWHTDPRAFSAVGLRAWNQALADTGFVSTPLSSASRWHRRWSIRWAQLERKLMPARDTRSTDQGSGRP